MIDRDKINIASKETTDASERALLEQAHSYRTPKNMLNSFSNKSMNPKAKKAFIATCFIPIFSFIAGGFAIYFGRQAIKETGKSQDKNYWASMVALVAGSMTMIPLTFLIVVYLRNGLLTAGW